MKILVWIWNIKNALDLLCLWGWVRFVQPDSICDGAIFVSWHNMITSFDGGPWNCGLEAFRGSLKELQSLKCQQKWKDTVVFYWYLYIYLHSGEIFFAKPSHPSSRNFCKNKQILFQYEEHVCRSLCTTWM